MQLLSELTNLKRCQFRACQSYSALRFHEGVGTSLSGGRPGLPGPGQCSSLRERQKGIPPFLNTGRHFNLTHFP